MESVIVVLVLTLIVSAVVFYFGMTYGRRVEQLAVAKILAQYSGLDTAAGYAVSQILRALRNEYTRAYNDVVDEIRQFEIDLKRSSHG
jgi:hypothetical protein